MPAARTDDLLTRIMTWSRAAGATWYSWIPPRLPFEPCGVDAAVGVGSTDCSPGKFRTAVGHCQPALDADERPASGLMPPTNSKPARILFAEMDYIRREAPGLQRALVALNASTGKSAQMLLPQLHISKWTDTANDLSGDFEQSVTDIRLQELIRDAADPQQTAKYTELHSHESLRLTLEGDTPDIFHAELNTETVLGEVKQLLAVVNGWLPAGLSANERRWMKTAPVAERLAFIAAHDRLSDVGNMTTAGGALNAVQTLQTMLNEKRINEVADVTTFAGRWLADTYGVPADILQKSITVSGQAMMRVICPGLDGGRERYAFSYQKSLWFAARTLPRGNERCDGADVGQHWKRLLEARGEELPPWCRRRTMADVPVGAEVVTCNIQYPPEVENSRPLRQMFRVLSTPDRFRQQWDQFAGQWQQDPELTATLVLRLEWLLNTRLDDLAGERSPALTASLDGAQKAQLKAGALAVRLGKARPLFLKHTGTGRVADQLILLPDPGRNEYFTVSLSGSTPVRSITLHVLDFGDGSTRYVSKADYVHTERGYSVAEVSDRLGVSAHSLYKWLRAIKPDNSEQHARELAAVYCCPGQSGLGHRHHLQCARSSGRAWTLK